MRACQLPGLLLGVRGYLAACRITAARAQQQRAAAHPVDPSSCFLSAHLLSSVQRCCIALADVAVEIGTSDDHGRSHDACRTDLSDAAAPVDGSSCVYQLGHESKLLLPPRSTPGCSFKARSFVDRQTAQFPD